MSLDFNKECGNGISFKQDQKGWWATNDPEARYAEFSKATRKVETEEKVDEVKAFVLSVNEYGEPRINDPDAIPPALTKGAFYKETVKQFLNGHYGEYHGPSRSNELRLNIRSSTALARGVKVGSHAGRAPYSRLGPNELQSFISDEHYPQQVLQPLIDPNQMRVARAEAIVRHWWKLQNDPNARPFEFHHVVINNTMEPRVPRVLLSTGTPSSCDTGSSLSPEGGSSTTMGTHHDAGVGPSHKPGKPGTRKRRQTRSKSQKSMRDLDTEEEDNGSGDELPSIPAITKPPSSRAGARVEGTQIVSDDDDNMPMDEGSSSRY